MISTEPSENDWLSVNEVTIKRPEGTRRFDVVLYCNGLPIAVVEPKKAGSARALLIQLDQLTAAYDWRGKLLAGWKYVKVTTGLANDLRAQRPVPGSGAEGADEVESTADRFRRLSTALVRAWALASGSDALAAAQPAVRFYERSASTWPSSTPKSVGPAVVRSPRRSSVCSATSSPRTPSRAR